MPTQRSVAVQFWSSPAIRPTSSDAKLLALYCLTGPHSNFAGLFTLSWDDCQDYTALPRKRVASGLEELGNVQGDGEPFLWYDPATRLIWIPKRIFYEFRAGKMSGIQLLGMRRILDACPPCQLLFRACERYQGMGEPFVTFAEGLRRRLGEALPKGSEEPLPEGLPKGLAEPLPKGTESGSLLSSPVSLLSKDRETGTDPAGGGSADSSGNGTGKAGNHAPTEEQSARLALVARDLEAQAKETGDRFNPHACLQRMVNHGLSVDIGIQVLLRCREAHTKGMAKSPPEPIRARWAWTQTVLDREYAALHIRLQEQEHERVKKQKPNMQVLGEIMRGIGEPKPDTDEAFR